MEKLNLKDSVLTCKNGVATLYFNRDDIRNALTGSNLIKDIKATAKWVNINTNISVLIITGKGKAFSSGGNIKDMKDRKSIFSGKVNEIEDKYRQGIQTIPKVMEGIEIPTIAAVNGPAIGAGCDLACMCDIRIAGRSASFAESFINLGIIPGDGGAYFLQKIIGYQKAAELTFTGKSISAKEALSLGLILKLTSDKNLMSESIKLAEEISKKPKVALRYTKRLLNMASRLQLSDFLDLCAVFQGVCHNDPEHQKALESFLKRKN